MSGLNCSCNGLIKSNWTYLFPVNEDEEEHEEEEDDAEGEEKEEEGDEEEKSNDYPGDFAWKAAWERLHLKLTALYQEEICCVFVVHGISLMHSYWKFFLLFLDCTLNSDRFLFVYYRIFLLLLWVYFILFFFMECLYCCKLLFNFCNIILLVEFFVRTFQCHKTKYIHFDVVVFYASNMLG